MLSPRAESFKQDLTSALVKELEIARRIAQGERSNEASTGHFLRQQGSGYVYEFEDLTGFPPDEGVQISFTVGEKTSKGKYLGEIDSKFLFELDRDLGPEIDKVTVVSDPLFLLEKMIEKLDKIEPFENQSALSSVGLADSPASATIQADNKFMQGLNSLQMDTLNVVTRNTVTYIWGPPGTGKTTTMGSVVAALADAGQRVLLVSNTNLALDTALERCLDRYSDFSELTEGLMLRIGTMVKPELIDKFSGFIDLEVIHAREVKSLQDEMQVLSLKLSEIKNQLSDLHELRRKFEQSKTEEQGVSGLGSEISNLKAQIEVAYRDIESLRKHISFIESEYKTASSKGALSRLLSGAKNPDSLRREINQSQRTKEKLESDALNKGKEIARLESRSQEVQQQAIRAREWLESNPDVKSKIAVIPEIESKSKTMQDQIEAIKEKISKNRAEIMQRAKVISCTAFKTILDSELARLKFDCVVIDEASMLQLPLYYCAASLTADRIVVAGDFRQLPPIVKINGYGNTEALRLENERLRDLMVSNPFTKSGVIARGTHAQELVALRDQYRMRQPISDLISTNFYPEHTLRTVNEKTDKTTPWGNESFFFVDTASLEPESSPVNGKSRRNVAHAIVIKALVDSLHADGWRFDSTAEKSFAVITPYAKQSSFIEALVGANESIKVKGGISTVHRFQGNERDLIILDLTKVSSESDPSLGSFLGNPDPLASENAMWNVAISRARQHVIVVGHKPTLEQNPSALITRLVNSMAVEMKTIDASELVDWEIAQKLDSAFTSSGSIAWFTGESFYKTFSADINSAKQKLFLASPFTTQQGSERWYETLRALKDSEVQSVLLTKPLGEKSNLEESSKVHEELNEILGELKLVPKMHEKLAVIDNRIVWLGSLNILSHKNASEIMMRVESGEFAKSITDEYLLQRLAGNKPPRVNSDGTAIKAGDPCDSPGCLGEMILRPAGISKSSGRPYAAFLSCNQFPRCKNSVNF